MVCETRKYLGISNGDSGDRNNRLFVLTGWFVGRYDDELLLVGHEFVRLVELVSKEKQYNDCENFKNKYA